MYVDKIDGNPTRFHLADSVVIEAGRHEVDVRMEYSPAAGTAIVVGSLANILLRSATNKTFTTTMEIIVEKNKTYRFEVYGFDNSFKIQVNNITDKTVISEYIFELKDGQFKRIYNDL